MPRIIGALIAHLASYLTTLAFAAHMMRPKDGTSWAAVLAAALAAEALVYAMKETLWDGNTGNDPVGWLGIALDGIINTGGILPFAPRVLTYGPISLSLGMIGLNVADPFTATVAAGVISLILGFLLSILPHWLWHRKKRAKKE